MTRGTWHVTDVSNACRTLLFDLTTGVWDSTDDLRDTWQLDRRFEPAADRQAADAAHARWIEAVGRSKNWA